MDPDRLFARFASLTFVLLVAATLASPARADESRIEQLRGMIAQGQFAEAEEAGTVWLAELERAGKTDSLEAARVLDAMAELRWRTGRLGEPETRAQAERALEIKQARLGPDDAEVAESLNNLGVIAFLQGDFEAARPPWERALAIREQVLEPGHIDIAESLNSLANLHQTVGAYDKARPLHERALAIREQQLGPDHPEVAKSVNNLANLDRHVGNFVEARAGFERALAIREKRLPAAHPHTASSTMALASVLWRTGDRERSRELFQRTIELWTESLGKNHPYVGHAKNALGFQLMTAGDYDAALPLFESALTIWKAAYGTEHADVGLGLNNLGELHELQGELDRALRLLEHAAEVREHALGPEHPDLGESLNTLGRTRFKHGDGPEAREALERAVAIRRGTFGDEHPDVAESLVVLAGLLTAMGESATAVDHALESEQIARDHLRLTGRSLSERDALRYAAVRNRGLDLALSLALENPEVAGPVLDALIRSRGVVLDEMAARSHSIVSSADPEVARLAEELADARSKLARLTVGGLGENDPQVYRGLLDEARDEKDAAERALAEASASFAQELQRSRLGLEDVVSSLPAESALVAFVLHEQSRRVDEPLEEDRVRPLVTRPGYSALVLRSGATQPTALFLGTALEIDNMVSRWKEEVTTGATNIRRSAEESAVAYRSVGGALRRTVWDPLAPHLDGAKQVFFVPDGSLNLLSFASLPIDDGRYLIEEGPLLHYLSAERDLVTDPDQVPPGSGLLALGGPDYDNASPVARTPAEEATTRSSCGSFDTLKFKPLPAAEREAGEVAGLWRETSPDGVTHLSGSEATETAFRNSAVGRRVLHIATHGFFLGGDCAPASTRSRGFTVVEEQQAPGAAEFGLSPLLLSGLAMAGANQRASAAEGENDGVLTAEEIASLKLSGVEWAVLSACNTGVGEIEAGEGVFGLRRAIQVAGVRTLIMSLWPVDDEATRLWMKTLYHERLVEKSATADAVRAAGLSVLNGRRAADASEHPFYWAAFVAAGDWR